MNGMVTREGITKDLEEMKKAGLGGAQMFHVTDGIPPGPVGYMTPQWRALVKHAVQTADRLGLELCIHNCAGWSSSGGPWIKPEQAMQFLTWSEVEVTGPKQVSETLPQPPAKLDFYRDIAVLAFPTPPADQAKMTALSPRVTTSASGVDGAAVLDGQNRTFVTLPKPSATAPQYVQFAFAKPFRARSLVLVPGPGRNSHGGELQVSDDGRTFKKVCEFRIPLLGRRSTTLQQTFPLVTARVYRVVFTRRDTRAPGIRVAEIRLTAAYRLSNWRGKAGFIRSDRPRPDQVLLGPEATISRQRIVDLTGKATGTGKSLRLTWTVPAGRWTIMRFGYTPTGRMNAPAPEEGRGLECDKLSTAGAEAHWNGMMAKVLADIGPLAGKTLTGVLIDSYEVGAQNWTARFPQEFRQRRGYDLLPYLPVMTGRVVDSVDVSERVLWDVRRTIADLFAEKYFGHFAEMAHAHGLELSVEPYGNAGFDCLTSGGEADIPMTEFWVGHASDIGGAKLAGSIAHTYGRKYVGAESFTAGPAQGAWRNHPYTLKRLGDLMWCGGVNRFIFHEFAHQPWLDRKPGMTMGPHGFHFEWTTTWWPQAPAWTTYLARSQFLLQQGLFVADLLYFNGEGSPSSLPGPRGLHPSPPPGYDYDGCDAKVLLTRLSVQKGRLVLPDGMSYRVLVLPPDRMMTPPVLRRIQELTAEGATVVGPRPERSPGLQGYPGADAEVRRLAAGLWGPCDGNKVTEHAYGKGRIVWGKPLTEVLTAMGVPPDFEYAADREDARLSWIHRRVGAAEVYFVSNQTERYEPVRCTFRVAGKQPELWHPDTGAIEPAPLFSPGGRTTVTLLLKPYGSVFVVFRRPVATADPVAVVRRGGTEALRPRPTHVPDVRIVEATYGVLKPQLPELTDVTEKVARLVRNNKLTVRADNSLAGDPAPNIVKQMRVEYTLDGKPFVKTVDENQTLTLPPAGAKGKLVIRRAWYGVIPEKIPKPNQKLTVDVADILQKRVRDGQLSIVADNSLAGDPAHLIHKQLRVVYTVDGVGYVRVVNENQTLTIPGASLHAYPAAEVVIAPTGEPTLRAWQPGTYDLQRASGKHQTISVASVPRPVVLAGPWRLRFPSNWGAPPQVTLPKLISWTDHDDPGVKYFSGTAVYTKEFTLPGALFAPGNVLSLDLGVVKNIAEVTVNGKYLGILWKPPFRVDVTDLVKPGSNRLEIRVTNNWPNRLIGDERLPPDDRKWSGDRLAEWPQWVLEGKPVPKTRRYTWTTWRHYRADSPLFVSGLLGPVTVRAAVQKTVHAR